ncbi:MAG: antitoxin Xre/MbcA/ParS toxin-binding domain-containing protein [Luteolibacter sp.]|uniref:type II RES/Xre toxin-antitoxin system antitoxin n=1 Tax=Luteolibacter sp. TaxID=1962973 RepID=UPI003266983B
MKNSLPTSKVKKSVAGKVLSASLRKAGSAKVKTKAAAKAPSLVQSCIYASSGQAAVSAPPPSLLIASLKTGLKMEELEVLRSSLDLPMDRLAPMLGISKATLHRRKAAGRLDPSESDRVVRFARLTGKAIDILESLQSARSWLTSPQFGLGGAIPLEYAETEVGAREVEDLLGRIEYGVFS